MACIAVAYTVSQHLCAAEGTTRAYGETRGSMMSWRTQRSVLAIMSFDTPGHQFCSVRHFSSPAWRPIQHVSYLNCAIDSKRARGKVEGAVVSRRTLFHYSPMLSKFLLE